MLTRVCRDEILLEPMDTTQEKSFALLRIAFGVVWLIDASFKWSPAFLNNFTSYLVQGAQDQPMWVQAWINLWIKGVGVDPHLFAILVALGETAIAIGLLLGLLTEVTLLGGVLMILVIWSTAEGFGGPYVPGATDIGAGIIYVFVFIALWLGKSWRRYSLDSFLKEKINALYWNW